MALPTKFDSDYVPVYGSHETEKREWGAVGIGTGVFAWAGFAWLEHVYSRLMHEFNTTSNPVISASDHSQAGIILAAMLLVAVIGTGILAAGLITTLQMPKWWEEQAKRRALEVREIDYDYLAEDIQERLASIAGNANASIAYVVGDRSVTTVRFPKAWYEKRRANGTCVINTELAVEVRVPKGTTVAEWLRLEGGAAAVEETTADQIEA